MSKPLTHLRDDAAARGLYRPEMERDACGVGFVARVSGGPSHEVIVQALTVLENLEHRGASASDPQTGDGAGILLQIPEALLREECAKIGIALGAPGTWGVGMLFLPPDPERQAVLLALLQEITEREGQDFLGVRVVPVDPKAAGPSARASAPHVVQALIGPGTLAADDHALERKLYVIRKCFESEARSRGLEEGEHPYVASMSTRTIVYKGLLTPEQLPRFYLDLSDPRSRSALAVVHQRFSTNTFPSWSRAHPYRRIAHNGEINTLRGNVNWMRGREPALASLTFGEDVAKLFPIVDERGSDSAMFDDVLELLAHTGRSLPHALMMMVPEATLADPTMSPEKRAFYEYHACLMEPWDGPACVVWSDGRMVGATLDRNGLRPARYVVTDDGLVVLASEVGVLELPAAHIVAKNRLQPGRMLVIDTELGKILLDAEIKEKVAARRPWQRWIEEQRVDLGKLPEPRSPVPTPLERPARHRLMRALGYTQEDLRLVLPALAEGAEALGSMGNDTPPAPLASRSGAAPLLYNYFRQRFAQVTNPPIDPIREALVMSLVQPIGPEANLFKESPQHARKLNLPSPLLTTDELQRIVELDREGLRAVRVPCLATVDEGGTLDVETALVRIAAAAEAAVRRGASILVLSDRGADFGSMVVPPLLCLGAVGDRLIKAGLRKDCGIVVESADPREAHHIALLIGYGAGAVCPWLALEAVGELVEDGVVEGPIEAAQHRTLKALEKGLLKVMSKMGISTVQSYRGAQMFEALGLSEALIARFFPGTPTHLSGIELADVFSDAATRHRAAYRKTVLAVLADPSTGEGADLLPGGRYALRRNGEQHAWNPATLGMLQHAVRSGSFEKYQAFAARVDREARGDLGDGKGSEGAGFVRGLFDFAEREAIPLNQVEPAIEIVKRMKTGAMSFGSISKEAHETLAIAMNRLGARSNTGEGGEDAERFVPDANGDLRRSAIKQVASGRFGVTIDYLTHADEIQIKVAQGAKPGEGGQLPGHKVDAAIARTRHATEGVGLISPPPHHDIYSIEDLAQLIHDLKHANPSARISVKLVAEAGVGTVAAGVAKAKADVIVIAGDAGGTGASPLSSLSHAGVPWELGLAEAQQVLVLNGLRGRVRLETDGQLKTGRDVVIAALLGAEEMAFGTAALVSMGCVMMRVCHLNTCPVGIATQDPRLRERFPGLPEHVVTFFSFVAEDVRHHMAALGIRTFDELIGRTDLLKARTDRSGRLASLDVSRLLWSPPVTEKGARRFTTPQDHEIELAMDTVLIEQARPAIDRGEPVEIEMPIKNVHRAAGTMLSHELTRRRGPMAPPLPDATIRVRFTGSAGQSFGAFLAKGIELVLEGDANDGFGKGLSGGRLVTFPPPGAGFVPEENILVGNVALYGATSGEVFIRGCAGERFAVRNSGAIAVVEGCGDHGCEYMTGGRVVVLGATGRNFGAGMSGGIAYVLDPQPGMLASRINPAMVELESLDETDLSLVRTLVHRHWQRTQSALAWRVLSGWKAASRTLVKVMPKDLKRALADRSTATAKEA